MTKRDFFMLTIKLFGLFAVIKSLFEFIPMMIISLDPGAIYVYIEVTAAVIVLSLILIFKSDKIIHLLKLDKGFEEEWMGFENITSVDVVKIGTFIIGGLLFVQNVPQFLIQSYNAFSYDANEMGYSAFNGKVMVVCCLNLVIGYLLITNYQFVAKILNWEKEEIDEDLAE